MGVWEWVFPITAQKKELLNVRKSMARIVEVQNKSSRNRKKEVDALEGEQAYTDLALAALVTLLVEKGLITHQELMDRLKRLDELDGVPDAKLTPELIRAAIAGMGKAEDKPAK